LEELIEYILGGCDFLEQPAKKFYKQCNICLTEGFVMINEGNLRETFAALVNCINIYNSTAVHSVAARMISKYRNHLSALNRLLAEISIGEIALIIDIYLEYLYYPKDGGRYNSQLRFFWIGKEGLTPIAGIIAANCKVYQITWYEELKRRLYEYYDTLVNTGDDFQWGEKLTNLYVILDILLADQDPRSLEILDEFRDNRDKLPYFIGKQDFFDTLEKSLQGNCNYFKTQ
jgi:hypothetical protein